MEKSKKNAIVLSVIAVVTLIALVVGATYAYFKAQGGTGKSTDVKVTTYTTDMLTFTTGSAISLYADQSSFGQEKGSLSGETFAKATLVANKKTITATPSKEEQYTLKLTFVNYEGDQTENAKSTLSAKVMIQKELIPQVVSDVCTNGENLATCITTLAGKSSASLTKIYHHDASLTNGAGDNSYRFAGASDQVNNYVCFGSNASTCPTDNLYRIIGVFDTQVGEDKTEQRVKLIKSDYATSTLLGADGDYIRMYTANNWDNSDYKGNNLANVAAYNWNKSNQNTWSLSNLNKTNLNKNFIKNIGTDWAAKIAETTWKVGGFNDSGRPAQTVYQNEVVNPVPGKYSTEIDSKAKIGLMYVSDYGFAAAPSAWTADLNTYNGEAIKVNWMYMGLMEWTISRYADFSDFAFLVANIGVVSITNVDRSAYAVRPVFSLTSSVNYVSGSGTAADPILVN